MTDAQKDRFTFARRPEPPPAPPADRAALVAERDRLNADLARLVDRQRRELGPLESDVRSARAALQAAERAVGAAQLRHREAVAPMERNLDRVRYLIEASAPHEMIARFREAANEAIAGAWKQADAVRDRDIAGRIVEVWSNQASVCGRVEAIQASIHHADALKLEALDEAALEQRLVRLAESWPPIDERPAEFCWPGPGGGGSGARW